MDLVLAIIKNLDDIESNALCEKKFLDFGAGVLPDALLNRNSGNSLLCSKVASAYNFREVCGIDIVKSYCEVGVKLLRFLEKPKILNSQVIIKWAISDEDSVVENWFHTYDIVYMHNVQFTSQTNTKMWEHFTQFFNGSAMKILISI
jgi:hypothetical protein